MSEGRHRYEIRRLIRKVPRHRRTVLFGRSRFCCWPHKERRISLHSLEQRSTNRRDLLGDIGRPGIKLGRLATTLHLARRRNEFEPVYKNDERIGLLAKERIS